MRYDTSHREKGRAVFLSVIMVLSVIAMSAAFAGSGMASSHADEPLDGVDDLDDGERLYQGQVGVVSVADVETATGETYDEYVDLYDPDHDWIRELTVYDANNASDAESDLGLEDDALNNTDAETDDFIVIQTDMLEQGTYHLGEDGDDVDSFEFDVRVQTLTAEFEDDAVANEVPQSDTNLHIDSARATFNPVVSAEDLSADDLVDIFGDETEDHVAEVDEDADEIYLVNRGNFDVDFDGIDAGNYTFTVGASDTTAEDTAEIEVSDTPPIQLEFTESSYDYTQGEIADISIDLQGTDEAVVQVGNAEEQWYEIGLEIDASDYDGDQVNIKANLFAAGGGGFAGSEDRVDHYDPNAFWNVEQDDVDLTVSYMNSFAHDFESYPTQVENDEWNPLLQALGYDLAIGESWNQTAPYHDNVTLEDEGDLAILNVQEVSVDDFDLPELVTAPGSDDVIGADNLNDTTWTETEEFADGDHMALRVEMGNDGIVDTLRWATEAISNNDFDTHDRAEDGSEAFGLIMGESGLVIEVQPPGIPEEFATGWNNTEAAVAAENMDPLFTEAYNLENYDGTLWLGLNYTADTAVTEPLTVGEQYEVTVDIEDVLDNLGMSAEEAVEELGLDPDEVELSEILSNDMIIQEPWIDVGSQYTEVPVSPEAEVGGTTNLAPGSEVTANARSDEGADRFNLVGEGGEVVATEDAAHAWTDTLDTSAQQEGTNFVLRATGPHDAEGQIEAMLGDEVDIDEPYFQVTASVDPSDNVEPGTEATLDWNIENIGDEAGTSSYEVVIDGNVVDDGDLDFEPGDSESGTETLETDEEGEIDWEVSTDDDDAAGTLVIEEAPPEEQDTDAPDDDEDDDDDDDVPGFGVAVAIVALLGAAMLALRRQD